MQTNFSLAQLADPEIQAAEQILRTCVHCGFCTATCPTYVLGGDERDSPRGRIYLIKDMLENAATRGPAESHVTHVDRCLSCLSCMSTCPSGVHYMHLVDQARTHIEQHYRRPLVQRLLRGVLGRMLVRDWAFRLGLMGAGLSRRLAPLLPRHGVWRVFRAMLTLAPTHLPAPSWSDRPATHPATGTRRKRVALLTGCAQPVLRPAINEATIRLLTRAGCEVVVAKGAGCCGGLNHHIGRHHAALAAVKANIVAWEREIAAGGLDAIVINMSGCGTTVKDYGWMLRDDPVWAARADRIAGLARDVSEVLLDLPLPAAVRRPGLTVVYHSACSMQHGQRLKTQPQALLRAAGFEVVEPAESHLCCGSAGTYNMLQSEIAEQLKTRKQANLARTGAAVVATGNIGCIEQLRGGFDLPVVHTVELLDWVTGGEGPAELMNRGEGPAELTNRGEGPAELMNRGEGPAELTNRGKGPAGVTRDTHAPAGIAG